MFGNSYISFAVAICLILFVSTACDSEFVKQEDCRLFCEKSQECSELFTAELFETCWSYCEELDRKWDGLANVSFDRADFACVEYESCDEFNTCVINHAGDNASDGDAENEAASETDSEMQD